MNIQVNKTVFSKIEITLSDYKLDESPNWDDFKFEFLKILFREHETGILLTMRTNKESLLWEYGKPINGKFEKHKYLYLREKIAPEHFKHIVNDYEFYLGGFFIVFTNVDQIFSEFISHIFSAEPGYKFCSVEYLFMSNDGETINWINPTNANIILNELKVKNLMPKV